MEMEVSCNVVTVIRVTAPALGFDNGLSLVLANLVWYTGCKRINLIDFAHVWWACRTTA